MSKIIYALTSQGRGHSSRVSAMAECLAARGHELLFCAGGESGEVLRAKGYPVIEMPVLRHVVRNNRLQIGASLVRMAKEEWKSRNFVGELAQRLKTENADLLVTDFETFSVRAARKIGLPVLCLNHQQILTHTRCEVPPGFRWDAMIARIAVRAACPSWASRVVVSSFFMPPLIEEQRTALVGPILRREILEATSKVGEHVLVYHNDPHGSEAFVDALAQFDQTFVLYNFQPTESQKAASNLQFKQAGGENFVEDLVNSKAVISTAGYTLMSEAIHLRKPMLVMPNQGIYEQAINAIYLEKMGLGMAVYDGHPIKEEIESFLSRLDEFRNSSLAPPAPGHEDAASWIEKTIEEVSSQS